VSSTERAVSAKVDPAGPEPRRHPRHRRNSSSFSLSESDEPSPVDPAHDQTVAPFSDQVRGEFDRDVKIDGAVRSNGVTMAVRTRPKRGVVILRSYQSFSSEPRTSAGATTRRTLRESDRADDLRIDDPQNSRSAIQSVDESRGRVNGVGRASATPWTNSRDQRSRDESSSPRRSPRGSLGAPRDPAAHRVDLDAAERVGTAARRRACGEVCRVNHLGQTGGRGALPRYPSPRRSTFPTGRRPSCRGAVR